ncbi:MAG: NlpC/P60 family protein [Agathobacter sp.]|nr:NlpC/P60 family protein [Agathobacter sp.]
MRKRYKRLISCLLIFTMVLSVPLIDGVGGTSQLFGTIKVLATTAKEKKKKAEEDLNKVNSEIDKLEDDAAQIKQNIDAKGKELEDLLDAQDKLKNDISNKQDEIDQCSRDLEAAKIVEQNQYDAMKLRIKFMYENSTSDSVWTAIVESEGIADLLNRIEYVSDIYKSDRQLMTEYQDAVAQVEELSAKLADEMNELIALQDKYESQQATLEAKIIELEGQADQYSSQIAQAQQQAEEFEKVISEQAAIIRAQEAAAAAAAANTYNGGGTNGGKSEAALSDPSNNPAPVTDVSGEAIVAYALQFVGNPYVWGGNSLTQGADCSGFVHLVYAHFGISTPRYSQAFLNQGNKVALANAQAGDVVVYPGHVAIYIGNGCIVEAQSTKAGITAYRSIQCHTITGIRRYI